MTVAPSNLSKEHLRAAALARRDDLRDGQRAAGAQAIATCPFPIGLSNGAIVAGYFPIRSEIDPRPLMKALEARGAQLALPVVVARDRALRFRVWHADRPLIAGPFNTSHPHDDAPDVIPEIVLVPLAAFDRSGHRIGYGGGYYDRTLCELRARKPVLAVGVAFAVQEVETVPASPHDAVLDIILTDGGTIDLRS